MTLKKALLWGLLGIPVGVFISYTVTVGISAILADGSYYPVPPALAASTGGEFSAVLVQYVTAMLLGYACAAGGCVWRIESWNFTRQTLVHFLLLVSAMTVSAYICYWVPRTAAAFAGYILLFAAIYAAIWLGYYLNWRKKLRAVNAKLRQKP